MTSIDATNRRLARRLGAAAFLATALALGGNVLVGPAIASAEQVWDMEETQKCEDAFAWQQMDMSLNEQKKLYEACCVLHGGVFKDDGYLGKCVAPPAPENQKPRHLPGNIQVPSDIATTPVVTQQQPPAAGGATQEQP
jgi:hypothetical protein